ncbi:hypothetical protein VTJ04DRAFT_3420 [Mycothermus thermophilus]|uniref:uncharacterized protein n=1 Tax=Humicola insolens TaxID=85995 RepID=UPI003743B482
MAPADTFSPPGSASYSSNTLSVGDGTWDFTKNTFLLPNLMGLNFETMRYNGMGNRFSSVAQYHSMILAHGVLAAITFLFLVPGAVFLTRFYTRRRGTAVRYHVYFHILAVFFTTVVFILGFIAVGPPRNLTNPHHGIGVAIYVMLLVQALGGNLILKLTGRRSFRLHVHRWLGRATALLGIVQIPLGLTLYGSPKALFILFAVWMGLLLILYFILDYVNDGYRDYERGRGTVRDDEISRVTSKSGGGKMKWLGPLAAGAGAVALFRSRSKKNKDAERGLSRSPSPSTVTRHTREPTVISSRRASDSYYYDEKSTVPPRRGGRDGEPSGGGFMNKLFAAGAGLGAGAVISKIISRKDHRDEYSAVSTDTPRRASHRHPARSEYTESEFTEYTEEPRRHHNRRDDESSVLPGPRPPPASSRGYTATPHRSRTGTSRFESTIDGSEYSSYVSPTQLSSPVEQRKSGASGAGKGFLAGMGLGFLAKLGLGGKNNRDRDEERMREEEDERRSGRRGSRYTGDGYSTPSRRESRRRRIRRSRPPPSEFTETSVFSGESSIEPRGATSYDPSSVRPQSQGTVPANGPPKPPIPPAGTMPGGSQQPPRYDVNDGPVKMPPMPRESDTDTYQSPTRQRSRRHQDPAAAAAAASASALALAAEEQRSREHAAAAAPGAPVSVRLRIDERDRNVTLRRLTEEEAMREQRRRERGDSVSSLSDTDPPGTGGSRGTSSARRYRRDSVSVTTSMRRDAESAGHLPPHSSTAAITGGGGGGSPASGVAPPPPPSTMTGGGGPPGTVADSSYLDEPLSPPNPAFARRSGGAAKDGPAGGPAGTTMSSLNSPGGSFSSMPLTDQDAAERRRRRRLERREGSRPGTTLEYS